MNAGRRTQRCLAIVCCLFSLPSLAAHYVVAVESLNYAPLYDGSDEQNYRGFGRDVLDLFAQRHGYTFSYVPLPTNRLFHEFFLSKKYDFKFPDNIAWQPELKKSLKVSYSDAIVSVTEGLFVPEHRAGRGLSDIKSIATINGFTPWPYSARIQSGAIMLSTTGSFESLIKMAYSRVDGIFASTVTVNSYQSKYEMPGPKLVLDLKLPHSTSSFTVSTIKHPAVMTQLNKFLKEDRTAINKIRRAYALPDE